jgi:alpha-galactosidase
MNHEPIHFRHGGVSLVVVPADGPPCLLHWGADLGELSSADLSGLMALGAPGRPHSAIDVPRRLGLVPDSASGFTGTPALEGFRLNGLGSPFPSPQAWLCEVASGSTGSTLTARGRDDEAGWDVEVTLALTGAGLLRMRTRVTNVGTGELQVTAARNVVPVGANATELLDLTGRWCKERVPQRHEFVQGTFTRTGRHGRTGHDSSLLLVAGTPGFGFGRGEVWGVHTAWSGNHITYAERTAEGDCVLGGSEALSPGEIVLAPGASYTSPWLLGSWSGRGLDGLSARLHAWLRDQSPLTRTERKVVINTWEAVYFDHNLATLTELADRAASVGVERFVLDDGWFLGRRNDRAGLGDWTVDPVVWPNGLQPLIDAVKARGMEFGLWVEPEMVNVDSELVRAHPDWVLRGRSSLPIDWRHQQVLDLQNPDAYAYILNALLALLGEYDIAYLKWDHNRDLIDAVHNGRPAVHGQTLAFYRLLDELRAAHPALEIESCSSGGARIDAEVLSRTDRVWASDTIDAVERQHIQTWTSLLVPPEMMGSHIGGPKAHTTGRSLRLGFRAATALLAHFGIEWDLRKADDATLDEVRRWVALHKQVRPHLATGTLVHGDHPDPAIVTTGLVSATGIDAWYVVATVATLATQSPAPVRLPGLEAARRYRVTCVTPKGDQHSMSLTPSWLTGEAFETSGAALGHVGVQLPALAPETAHVLHIAAVA